MQEQTIFDLLYPKFKFTKPIRLIELFAGYGSQALALKYLGVKFEHWKICEWAVKSIQAYKDIHFTDDNEDYSKNVDYKTICSILKTKGISSNYNEPMSMQQITRLSEKQVRKIYSNIIATNNLVNIQQVNGRDLSIVDTDKYDYVLTYSFPCQDLSLAGRGKGMSDTSTRSGLLWEVERILAECKQLGSMPQVLLMENVPQVHSVDNLQDFKKWILRLEELGYSNYFEDLIATDYGIPQTRNRCFMVSILGEYSYSFPPKQPLKIKLKDMLEDNVDEKFYLSDKMKEYIFSEDDKYKVNKNSLKLNRDIACSKTTREGNTRADTSDYITDDVNVVGYIPQWHQRGYIYDEENSMTTICATDYKTPKLVKTYNKSLQKTLEENEIDDTCYIDTYNKRIDKNNSGTITTGVSSRNNTFLAIKNATKQGYLETTDGDGVDISSRMEYHRGTVQKGLTQTLTTMGGENNGVISKDLRIRKLTPKECFRLMGVKDEDFEECSKHQSNASLYHLAGDSIVVNVLMAIFKEML